LSFPGGKDSDGAATIVTRDQPPTKKKKMEPGNDWLASDVGDIQDIDLEVYGSKLDDMNTAPTNAYVTSYSFEVCDSLLNVGPCSHVAMGEPQQRPIRMWN
jgi:cleavage and polyadenylation specificity factor subunit 1